MIVSLNFVPPFLVIISLNFCLFPSFDCPFHGDCCLELYSLLPGFPCPLLNDHLLELYCLLLGLGLGPPFFSDPPLKLSPFS